MSRADANCIKEFISSPVDDFRKSYGIDNHKYRRQCVFAGTVNPGGSGYLKDETGARRFWPVECGIGWEEGRKIDTARLNAEADQMWAEAVVRFKAGEPWWLDSRELEEAQELVPLHKGFDRLAFFCP